MIFSCETCNSIRSRTVHSDCKRFQALILNEVAQSSDCVSLHWITYAIFFSYCSFSTEVVFCKECCYFKTVCTGLSPELYILWLQYIKMLAKQEFYPVQTRLYYSSVIYISIPYVCFKESKHLWLPPIL